MDHVVPPSVVLRIRELSGETGSVQIHPTLELMKNTERNRLVTPVFMSVHCCAKAVVESENRRSRRYFFNRLYGCFTVQMSFEK